ncbi:MAG: LuxR C-terminal-related transcriptional regulator [Anaerolineae bacterium]|jgi:DNA-binding NarL/FixJ family response regulator
MIRVLLVNDIQLTCNVLTAVLEDEGDMTVVGCATTVNGALAQAPDCDVALVGTSLGNPGSLELVRQLKERVPGAKVLMLGLTESEDQVLPYIQAGAVGYVLPEDSVDDLMARIRVADQDRALISPEIAAALMNRLNEWAQRVQDSPGAKGAGLTPREWQVLNLIQEGYTNQQIADELVIEVGTVKNHVHNILRKLGVNSREDAAAYVDLVGQQPH